MYLGYYAQTTGMSREIRIREQRSEVRVLVIAAQRSLVLNCPRIFTTSSSATSNQCR
jgi:hypothetical protein